MNFSPVALQIMPGFNIECYTGLKWVKREYSLSHILNLSLPKFFWGNILNKTKNSSKNSKPFWRMRFGRGSVVHPPSNGKGLRSIQNSMSMVLDTSFHIWFIMTVYYEMRQLFYYKMRWNFITKCVRFFVTKCDSFIYKMRQLLQNATILLQNATSITKCDVCYILRQYTPHGNTCQGKVAKVTQKLRIECIRKSLLL